MAAEPWDTELAAAIQAAFPQDCRQLLQYRGQPFAWVDLRAVLPVLRWLKLHAAFDYLVDITAVDYPARSERFDLVYILFSSRRNLRLRLKALCGEQDTPASTVPVFPGADWLEREVFDMFGIRFRNHPDLRRILLWEEYPAHPLRKDYPLRGRGEREGYRVVDRTSA